MGPTGIHTRSVLVYMDVVSLPLSLSPPIPGVGLHFVLRLGCLRYSHAGHGAYYPVETLGLILQITSGYPPCRVSTPVEVMGDEPLLMSPRFRLDRHVGGTVAPVFAPPPATVVQILSKRILYGAYTKSK